MKRIFMVVAPENFRDSEYIVPRAFWGNNTVQRFYGLFRKKLLLGVSDIKSKKNILLSEADVDSADALFFVGGGGSLL